MRRLLLREPVRCADGGWRDARTRPQARPAHRAPAGASPAAGSPQPAALTGPLADDSTSLFAPRWNMFQLSGRLASIEGDPARWQRYEDLRDGLLFTTGRLLRERPEWSASLTADNRGMARPAILRQLRTDRPLHGERTVGSNPAVLQRGHANAVHLSRRGRPRAGRCGATRGEPQRLSADCPPIRPARAARHRHLRRQRDAHDARRRHRPLHDHEALGRAAVGRGFRLRQRQRGGAAVQVAHQRRRAGRAVDEHEGDDSRRLQRIVVQQHRRHAGLGQPAGAERQHDRARTRPDRAVAVELAADDEHGRIREARAGERSSPARWRTDGGTTTSRCCRSRSTVHCPSSRCRAPPPRRPRTRSRRT